MARKSIEERLAQLDAQRQALKARLGKEERAKDTRRKVLLGALVLHRLGEDKREFDRTLKEWLQRELPGFLSRPDDKALFDDLLAAPSARSQQDGSNTSEPDQMATVGIPET
ncbi:MAG: mobilization protein [Acidocella sp.]|nr:mobilization protein [Acidocella sp.]